MIFQSKAAKKKKLKKSLRMQKNRRLQIIMEARAIHQRAQKRQRKKTDDGMTMGGYSATQSLEEKDIAIAIGAGVTKAIAAPSKAVAKVAGKLKQRAKQLKQSKKTHLSRLKTARKTLKARGR